MPGVPAITQLPAGWQTVWLSRFYQEGPATHVALGRRFRAEALQGQWAKAVATLKSYTEYTARAKAEAALLEADITSGTQGAEAMKSLVTLVALLAAVATPVVAAPGERSATLRGSWRVGPVDDPTHHALPADVAAQLGHAHIPSPGEVVRAEPGKLCIGSSGCDEVTWTEVKLADVEYGPRYKLDFGLSPQTSVYQAATEDRFRTYTLLSRPDRTLMAVVILCQDSYRHNAYQVWSPANADARLTASGARRSGRY